MSEKEQQFERIYKETENFGRTQFVREIQMQINDNKKKDKEIERLHSIIKETRECINHYAIENEDYSKIYNDEEKELLEILDKVGDEV